MEAAGEESEELNLDPQGPTHRIAKRVDKNCGLDARAVLREVHTAPP